MDSEQAMSDYNDILNSLNFCLTHNEVSNVSMVVSQFIEENPNYFQPWQIDDMVCQVVMVKYRIDNIDSRWYN